MKLILEMYGVKTTVEQENDDLLMGEMLYRVAGLLRANGWSLPKGIRDVEDEEDFDECYWMYDD